MEGSKPSEKPSSETDERKFTFKKHSAAGSLHNFRLRIYGGYQGGVGWGRCAPRVTAVRTCDASEVVKAGLRYAFRGRQLHAVSSTSPALDSKCEGSRLIAPAAETIRDYPRLSETIRDRPRRSRTIQDYPRLSKTVRDHPRRSKTIQDYPRLSKTI
ncbi:hypothetical protein EYF80_043960 [Liparis tanakae]|uniref:Uncharacterized protein n=1 Tax=Liparis tanakae TaxID=230148 RepID=A0A4Z2FY66_9TELE|nr:hypothetical protein EYF80_043960 [Liparis tanakae]